MCCPKHLICCIWVIADQTASARQSLPPSFPCTIAMHLESGWDVLNQYFPIQKCWIGSWNFYLHRVRCTCLNSFYWAAALELWKMENLKQKESDLGPWTCSCCRSENVVKMFSRYLVNICNNTSETVLCGCPDCVFPCNSVAATQKVDFSRINRKTNQHQTNLKVWPDKLNSKYQSCQLSIWTNIARL